MKRTSKQPAVSAIPASGYADWLQALSRRYRQSQIKAAIAVNAEMLRFYFSLGADIVRMEKDQPWGSGFLKRLSSDLRKAMPDAQCFSVTNLKYMRGFFRLYAPCLIGHQVGGHLEKRTTDETMPAIGHQAGDRLPEASVFKLIFAVPWRHHIAIIDKFRTNPEAALFYVRQTVANGWSRSVLLNFLDTKLHERQGKALTNFASRLPESESDLAQEVTKDPYSCVIRQPSPPARSARGGEGVFRARPFSAVPPHKPRPPPWPSTVIRIAFIRRNVGLSFAHTNTLFMNPQFNRQLYNRLRKLLNEARVFWTNPELNSQFEFVCALMDRSNDAIQFLEEHASPPKTVDEVLLFLVNANAINEVFQTVFRKDSFFQKQMISFGIQRPADSLNHFIDAWKTTPFAKTGELPPSDTRFFSYFRALSFAHSCGTAKYKFLESNNETNYSPFVIPNQSSLCSDTHCNDKFGVLVYSNKRPESFHLLVSTTKLKAYLVELFDHLSLLADCIEKMEQQQQTAWLARKVARCDDSISTLNDIINILNERRIDNSDVEELLRLMVCPVSFRTDKNLSAVSSLRKTISDSIVIISDCIDTANYHFLHEITSSILTPHIGVDNQEHEQLEYLKRTIHSCLFHDKPFPDPRLLTEQLIGSFVGKWVDIRPYEMTLDEIWLLISSAWLAESNLTDNPN